MENQQQSKILAGIGGDPLEGSGFEAERPAFEEEVMFETPAEDQEVEDK